jgi:hypothetical protein
VTFLPEERAFAFNPSKDGTIVLGCPTGTEKYVSASVGDSLDTYTKHLKTLRTLNLQAPFAFGLLKHCLNAQVSYLARVLDGPARDGLAKFDREVDTTVLHIAGMHDLSDSAYLHFSQDGHDWSKSAREMCAALRSLPTHRGGCGIPRHSWVDGNIGAWKSRNFVQAFIPAANIPLNNAIYSNDIQFDKLNPLARDEFGGEYDNDTGLLTIKEVNETREAIYQTTVESLIKGLGNVYQGKAAWLRSNCYDGSGGWLTPPSGVRLPPAVSLFADEFRHALRQRLLIAPYTAPCSTVCVCGKQANAFNHFIRCRHANGIHGQRHDFVRDALTKFISKTHPTSTVSIENVMGDTSKRSDIIAVVNDVQYIIEVSIVDPAGMTYREAAAKVDDHASHQREIAKESKYRRNGIRDKFPDAQIVMFALEATGRLGKGATDFLTTMSSAKAPRKPSRPMFYYLVKQIGSIVAKRNAQAIYFMRKKIAAAQVPGQKGRVIVV